MPQARRFVRHDQSADGIPAMEQIDRDEFPEPVDLFAGGCGLELRREIWPLTGFPGGLESVATSINLPRTAEGVEGLGSVRHEETARQGT